MHHHLLLILSLLLAVCLLVMLGQRLGIAYPVFLVIAGLLISFIPGIPLITIDPELIFLFFLPPLLYEAAWFTSWKDFWKWKRVIGTFAFGVVLLTSGVVAIVTQALIPGFTLALGFLLGGIISPPDAVAATSVLKGISLPRRLIAILEGESLLNDASGLTVFRFALMAVLSGTFVWYEAAGQFLVLTINGTLIGLAVALVFYAIHRWLPTTPSIHTVLTLVTPHLMYLTAESLHASGVIAVVSGGLFLSIQSHHIFTPRNRLQGLSTWATITFILNGLIFIVIGLQLPVIFNNLGNYSRTEAIWYSLVVTGVIIFTRLACVMLTSWFTRFISNFIRTNDPNPGWKGPIIIGWAGMRGVVSLASALSIPVVTSNGAAFPERNLILFITFMVILLTLVVQGLTLPFLVRWVQVEERDGILPEHEQEAAIQENLLSVSLYCLDEKYSEEVKNNDLVTNLKKQLQKQIRIIRQGSEQPNWDETQQELILVYYRILKDLLRVKRQALLSLGKKH